MNKYCSFVLRACFCWLCTTTALRAQHGVEIVLSTPFPFQYNIEDLTYFTVNNHNGQSLEVYAVATVDKIPDKIRVAAVTTGFFTLNPGINIFFGAYAPYIRDKFIAPGYDHVRNTGQIPSGTYNICVTLYDSNSGVQAGEPACLYGFQVEAPRIILQSPANQSTVTGPFVNFIFEELSAQPAGITYGLKIVEKRHNQIGTDAMPGIAHFETKDLTLRFLQYPLEALELRPGATYYWQVTAYAGDIAVAESEIWEFTVGGQAGIIRGYKFDDRNGNGAWEGYGAIPGDEPGLEGVTITLDGPVRQTAVTDKHGHFQFVVTTPGVYTVSETIPADWRATTPTSATLELRLFEGETVPEILFGNHLVREGIPNSNSEEAGFQDSSVTQDEPAKNLNHCLHLENRKVCELSIWDLRAPYRADGYVDYFSFSWTHTLRCDACKEDNAQIIKIFDGEGKKVFESNLETTDDGRANFSARSTRWDIKVKNDGYMILSCAGNCDHGVAARWESTHPKVFGKRIHTCIAGHTWSGIGRDAVGPPLCQAYLKNCGKTCTAPHPAWGGWGHKCPDHAQWLEPCHDSTHSPMGACPHTCPGDRCLKPCVDLDH